MKKSIIIAILVVQTMSGLGQINKKAAELNVSGFNMIISKEYEKAIQAFTESLELEFNKEAYFNRAMAYHHLGLMAEFCDDIEMASMWLFKNSKELLNRDCYLIDTTYVDLDNLPVDSSNFIYLKVLRRNKYKDGGYFTVKDRNSELVLSYSVHKEDTIYSFLPDNMPEYQGGETALVSHLSKNIRYPNIARDNGITGTVFITFIVDAKGTVKNVKILKGIGGGCDEEAKRVVEMMPNWKPGYYNDRAVPVQYNLPIKFSLR